MEETYTEGDIPMKPMHDGSTIMLRIDDAFDLKNVQRWLEDVLEAGQTATVAIQIDGDAAAAIGRLDAVSAIHDAAHGQ